jgi:hypothetical protein
VVIFSRRDRGRRGGFDWLTFQAEREFREEIMKYSLWMLALAVALLLPTSKANADVTVGVDTSATWLGWMNVSELPENGGFYVFGSGWGVADLVAVFDNSSSTLTLAPNSVNDPNAFWYTPAGGPGSAGNKMMEANVYVENHDTLIGETVTFEGTVLSNTFTSAHSTVAFIKDFAPDYSSFNITTAPLTTGDFSITLATDPTPGRHVQYGFATTGVNVWITDVEPYGTLVIETVVPPSANGDFDNDGDVDGRDFLVWQRGETTPPLDPALLVEWQDNYGGPLAAVTAVPEPAGLVLVAAFVVLLPLRRSGG